MKDSVLFVALLMFTAAVWPHGAEGQSTGQSAEQSGAGSLAESSELAQDFVDRFNAGEVDALAEEYADRLDWRIFAWASDLGHLETISVGDVESYLAEHAASISDEEFRTAVETGWEKATRAAAEQDVQWVLANADGFAGAPELGVPAVIFGVVEGDEGESFAVGTVFVELIEELVSFGQTVSEVVEQGIGVEPQRFR